MDKRKLAAKFQRITNLFTEGREVVLDEGSDGEEPVLVWVNKLNPFEQEEARKDGSVGRARAVLTIDDPMSPEMALFNQALEGRTQEQVVEALVVSQRNEDYVEVIDDIKADEDWKDRLLILDRGDQQLADSGAPMDSEERSRMAQLNEEYMAEVDRRLTEKQQDRTAELMSLSMDECVEMYRDSYRNNTGSQGFINEYKISELYYSLRDCNAVTRDANGRWDHSKCDHRQRLLDSRADVITLPEQLIVRVRDAMNELHMTPKDAGNSDAPASSSASSEQPSAEVEQSTPSTPAGTSPVPVGTSSQP